MNKKGTGTNKGKFKLGLPNHQELTQMSNDELNTLLDSLNAQLLIVKGLKSKGDLPPGGNMREIRITKARILTIKQARGGK